MVEPQASQFWKAAERSGLLEDSALHKAWEEIPADKRTGDAIDRRLARQIVNSGALTLWQAQQILAGRWQGLRIDKYILLDVIGHGGMGRVYLAKDTRLSRQVALKILSRERMNNPRALARFRREAKVGAQLQHENLVRIYDEGESHGVRFLVMEYIDGRTVGQMIIEYGQIPPGMAADIARQVSLGLEHLHQKGLLHRDVNPMNILVDRHGTAKLTDLGLAIDTGDADDIVTRDGATVGTFDYISPEQAKHSRAADMRSDVYSLGCSLYHMITGQVPFPLPSLPEKLYAHQLSEPEPISSLVPGVPAGLEAIVAKSMRKLPEARYARPIDLAKALEPFARGIVPQDKIFGDLVDGTTTPPQAGVAPPGVTAVTPAGSDPDLELGRGVAASTPPMTSPASDPMDFIPKIDLGPRQPLSGTKRVAAPNRLKKLLQAASKRFRRDDSPALDGDHLRKYARILLAGSTLLVALGLMAVSWSQRDRIGRLFRSSSSSTHAATHDDKGKNSDPEDPPQTSTLGDVEIHFPDGHEEPEATLRGAIERSAGRVQSEIVIKAKTPLRMDGPGKTLMMTWGTMVIRAGNDVQPDLIITLSGKGPWIEVGPQARLKLVGLRIQIEVAEKAGGEPPTLIQAEGNVEFERCTFFTTSNDRGARVVVAEGLETRLTGCQFDGFDRPIRLGTYPGSHVQLSQCLFIRDATANLATGWAISAFREGSTPGQPRKLTLDHCTVVETGLLIAEGYEAANPLELTVKNSVIKTKSVVMTPPSQAETLGKFLRWTGKDNWYQISDASWAVVLPQGFAGPPGMPSDLKSWTDRMGNESGSREEPIEFLGKMQGEGRPAEDFAVKVDAGKAPTGIDPKSVGPSATSGKL